MMSDILMQARANIQNEHMLIAENIQSEALRNLARSRNFRFVEKPRSRQRKQKKSPRKTMRSKRIQN